MTEYFRVAQSLQKNSPVIFDKATKFPSKSLPIWLPTFLRQQFNYCQHYKSMQRNSNAENHGLGTQIKVEVF